MTTSSFNLVIPARSASTRFPGKPLVPLAGKPMILHVYDCACRTAAESVVVATDDERILKVCQDAGIDACLTQVDHPSGTDRVAEVCELRSWPDDTIVVCLQGDEPATPPAIVEQVAQNLAEHTSAAMATLCAPISSREEYLNPNRVKVVFTASGYALYFSRAPIPYRRDCTGDTDFPDAFVHIGMYAYRGAFLRRYRKLPAHPYEQEEKLEQLRALGNGYRIHVAVATDIPAHGVDRPEDVPLIESILLEEQKHVQ